MTIFLRILVVSKWTRKTKLVCFLKKHMRVKVKFSGALPTDYKVALTMNTKYEYYKTKLPHFA